MGRAEEAFATIASPHSGEVLANYNLTHHKHKPDDCQALASELAG